MKGGGYVIYNELFTCCLDLAPLSAHPQLLLVFFDVTGFFVCLVLIEYVVCSVLIEHVQCFELQVGLLTEGFSALEMYLLLLTQENYCFA